MNKIPNPYPFTASELEEAIETWGCNCGPASLSFATQRKLDEVKLAIPGFLEKGYTNPTMMKAGLKALDAEFRAEADHVGTILWKIARNAESGYTLANDSQGFKKLLSQTISLLRIQFTGPWTEKGIARWAYQHTHWICAWLTPPLANPDGSHVLIFDINGVNERELKQPYPNLINRMEVWESEILPRLTTGQERDGGWYPTHIWRVEG